MEFQLPLVSRGRAATFLLSYAGLAWLIIQVADVISPSLGLPAWVTTATIGVAVLALPFILLVYIFALPKLSPAYIDRQIDQAGMAKESVLLAVHTLDPSSRDARIASLQKALGEAAARGLDVRLISPGGADRVHAAYELSEIHGVPIRVVDELEDQDLRFTLVDERTVLLSHQTPREKSFSTTFSVIQSERLNSLLRTYFNQLWVRHDAMSFDQYLKRVCVDLGGVMTQASAQRLSDRLGVPAHVVRDVLEAVTPAAGTLSTEKPGRRTTLASTGQPASPSAGEA